MMIPDKLSDLILVALKDLENCEKDDRLRINMEVWMARDTGQPCMVCFAGAVMAKSLGVKVPHYRTMIGPADVSYDSGRKLLALDAARRGNVGLALNHLKHLVGGIGIEAIDHPLNRDVADYHEHPASFKIEMRKLANDLKKEGL